jgi:exodeoxyribonuclease V alpha subunit
MENGYRYDVKIDKKSHLDEYKLNSILSFDAYLYSKVYFNEENGYGIYTVKVEDDKYFKISGFFISDLIIGNKYKIKGKVSTYKGEKQLYIKEYERTLPKNEKEIMKYLSDFKKIEYHKEDLYEAFGMETLEIIKDSPEIIPSKIDSISINLALDWQEKLNNKEQVEFAAEMLLGLGLNNYEARSVLYKFGERVVFQIKEDPYFLVGKTKYFDFKKTDAMALERGEKLDSKNRIREAFKYILSKAEEKGHCFLDDGLLIKTTAKLLAYIIPTKKASSLLKKETFEYKNKKMIIEIDKDFLKKSLKKSKEKKLSYCYIYVPSKDNLKETLFELEKDNHFKIFEKKVYLKEIYDAEFYIAKKLRKIKEEEKNIDVDYKRMIDKYLQNKKINLEEKQREALEKAISKKGGVLIINGGPGCGKTFITKIIIDLLKQVSQMENFPFTIRLLAPTGKAAKVLSEATSYEATTIHRGLKYQDDGFFMVNEENPFRENLIIVDEASMLDVKIAASLFKAVLNHSKLIIIGDSNQLPPIGPGLVLKDIVRSDIIDTVTLNAPKRQLENSGIVYNTRKIIEKEMIHSQREKEDFFVLKKDTELECLTSVLTAVSEISIKKKISFDKIQILSPQKNGLLGVDSLNYHIQKILNGKNKGEKIYNKRVKALKDGKIIDKSLFFKKGDKVIHTKNNYNKEWYFKHKHLKYQIDYSIKGIANGETGVIDDIEIINEYGVERKRVVVKYDDGYVFYEDNFKELEHAYALTIHKSQGSQWEGVIIPIISSTIFNKKLYTNNLLYTACSRAKDIVVVTGDPEDIKRTILNNTQISRNTTLKEFLTSLT